MQTSSFLVTESFANQPYVALLEGRWLASEMVDYCSDRHYDWMGLLSTDREIEVYRLSLPKVKDSHPQKSYRLTIADLVQLTFQAPYQPIVVSEHQYWSYTCSLQIVGFGKVRFVVYFDHPKKTGSYLALVTNRLDWSASKILKHWMKYHAIAAIEPPENTQKSSHQRELQRV